MLAMYVAISYTPIPILIDPHSTFMNASMLFSKMILIAARVYLLVPIMIYNFLTGR